MVSVRKSNRVLPVTAQDFYSLRWAETPELSPDGSRVAWVLMAVNRLENSYDRCIWLTPFSGGPGKQFTLGGKGGDYMPRWSPDSRKLAFLSLRSGKAQVHVMDADGGEAGQLTSHINGVGYFCWSPSGKYIAFTARVNRTEQVQEGRRSHSRFREKAELQRRDEIRREKEAEKIDPRVVERMVFRNGTVFRDDRRNHVYIQPVGGGKANRITSGDYDFGIPSWDPAEKAIFTWAYLGEWEDVDVRTDILRIPIAKGKAVDVHTIMTSGSDGDMMPMISPDSTRIYFLSFSADRLFEQRLRIHSIPADGGAVSPVVEDFTMDPQANLQIGCRSGNLYFSMEERGNMPIFRCSGSGNPERIVGETGLIEHFSLSLDETRMAYSLNRPDIPRDIFVRDMASGKGRRLTNLNQKFLADRKMVLHEEFPFESFDGLKIDGWLLKPPDFEEGKAYPLAVEIHGGPHVMWGREFWHEFQMLASAGYVVFYCNPRGSAGYGWDFKGLIHRRWGEEDMRDILTGVDRIIDKGYVDPERLVVTGGSFGGFMTTWLIGHDDRFKAAVTQRGVYDMVSLYGNSDAYSLVEWEFDALPWRDPEFLWQRSPLAYIDRINTPLLIIHSEQDFRAGIHTADELFVALRRLGKEAVFVRYPREGHELSRSGEPKHRVDRLNRILEWFNRHLGIDQG